MKRYLQGAQAEKGFDIWEEMLPSPVGPVWMGFSPAGLRAVSFHRPGGESGPQWPVRQQQEEPELTSRLRQWRQETTDALKAYFAGELRTFEHLRLDVRGTAFQIKVWEAVRQTPFGAIITYQTLAHSLNLPRGARSVGGALGANPLPIIIPCHRVVASDGSLGGYSAGLHLKRLLLSHEQTILGRPPIPLHGPVRIEGGH